MNSQSPQFRQQMLTLLKKVSEWTCCCCQSVSWSVAKSANYKLVVKLKSFDIGYTVDRWTTQLKGLF